MIVHSWEITNWRASERARLDDLSEGINLISAPNEGGKSSLVEGLRFAFSVHHRSKSADQKRVANHNFSAPPAVEVVFEADGQRCRLRKQWLKSEGAVLETPTETYDGDHAEEALSKLLGLRDTIPSRGNTSGIGHLGIWPLLFVEQHSSADSPDSRLTDHAKQDLQAQISTEIGEVAVGVLGAHVLRRAGETYAQYWTGRTGKMTGSLKSAAKTLEDAKEAREKARRDRDAAEQAATQLADAERRLQEIGPRLDKRAHALARAKTAADTAAAARQDLAIQEASLGQATSELTVAESALGMRTEREERLRDANARIATEQEQLDQAEDLLATESAAFAAAETVLGQCTTTLTRAQNHRQIASSKARLTRLRATLADLRMRQGKIAELQIQIDTLLAKSRKIKVSKRLLQQLEQAHKAASTAEATLAGAAARVEIEPLGEDLRVAGTPVARGSRYQKTCTDVTVLELENVARVHVYPGGKDLEELQDEVRTHAAALQTLLNEANATSIEDAREQAMQLQQLQVESAGLRQSQTSWYPVDLQDKADRVTLLGQSIALQEGDLEGLEEELAGSTLPEGMDESTAETALSAAQLAEAEARAALDVARDRREAALNAQRGLTGSISNHRTTAADLESLLAKMSPTADLQQRVVAARTAKADIEGKVTQLRERYNATGGDLAAETRTEAEKALKRIQVEQQEIQEEKIRAEALLSSHSEEPLHERLQDAEAALARAQQQFDSLHARAQAARRLHEVLQAAQSELKRKLTAPIVMKARPYLQRLLSGMDLRLGDDFELRGITDGIGTEEFRELSGGTREQVALILRLALAEYLSNGSRLPLILDDALPNTDLERTERMAGILQTAARKLQILCFTCQGENYDALGDIRSIRFPRRR